MINTFKYGSRFDAGKFALTSAAGNSAGLANLEITSLLRAAISASETSTAISLAI